MAEDSVLLYYIDAQGHGQVSTSSSVSSHTLSETTEYRLWVRKGGVADSITLTYGAEMEMEAGAEASHITIDRQRGSSPTPCLLMYGGTVSDVTVMGLAKAYYSSVLDGMTVSGGAETSLYYGSLGKNVTLLEGGVLYMQLASYAINVSVASGCTILMGGQSSAKGIDMAAGGAISLAESSMAEDVTMAFGATCYLRSGSVLSGKLNIAAGAQILAESGTYIDFTLNSVTPGNNAFIEDFTCISGTPYFLASVSEAQAAGTYALAGNAGAFDSAVFLSCGSYVAMELASGYVGTYHNSVYALTKDNGTLSVEVADYRTTGSADGLSWDDINDAQSYVLSFTGGGRNLAMQLSTEGVDLLGLANGDYTWSVRNAMEGDNWQEGQAFTCSGAPVGPQMLAAATNGAADLFFAKAADVWGADYAARHAGTVGGWGGTGDIVSLGGKARVTDIFAGSDDASILVLCDEGDASTRSVSLQPTGVALFIDDIYSAAAGTAEQARLSKINTIIAGAGDDVIDLTSQRFAFDGGVFVQGGAGDDVIWANSGENVLLGGEGNDRMVGAAGDDVLVGGAGNDTLHGGGGEDIFCFGGSWGDDTVTQLADGNVVLWFAEGSLGNWNASTLTYSDGGGSVAVTGVTAENIDIRFGAEDERYAERYAVLAAIGAFA